MFLVNMYKVLGVRARVSFLDCLPDDHGLVEHCRGIEMPFPKPAMIASVAAGMKAAIKAATKATTVYSQRTLAIRRTSCSFFFFLAS